MAKRSTKFGTFGGVFTPSILTILGVIMYLRLPRVIGDGGLWLTLIVIAAAHVISVTTGLSISSIATDKKVGAGGPYYIISRSLGLPIGGTLGLALFVGLSFSISLYVIGFSESFLSFWELDPSKDNIRICGSITLVVLTLVTLISTAFAIKTQYIILVFIGLSLFSLFLAPSQGVVTPHLAPPQNDPGSMVEMFGIFFPAVTGFTAGVNMSGDLKDPKKAIPVGTLTAIGTGLIVYIGLAIFLAYRLPVDAMRDNTNILVEVSRFGWMVIAGIWGATLSSGLGSILGAPRILQALGGDRVMPRFFAKGHGKDNEPRRALVLAVLIAEGGIIIGELDAIARLVSTFFIATYGFLNFSCAIEAWASTDFRPEFRIPKTVSVIGALVCVALMVQLDPWSSLAAAALFTMVFAILKRRQLALESGDTWEGVWSSLVRWGLERLQYDRGGQQRNWRPNVVSLNYGALDDRVHLREFGVELIRDRGVLTEFFLRTPDGDRHDKDDHDKDDHDKDSDDPSLTDTGLARLRLRRGQTEDALTVGLFEREIETETPWSTMRSIVRYHGFAGLEPNTVLMSWYEYKHGPKEFLRTLDELAELDHNVLLYGPDPTRGFGNREKIDLWWSPDRPVFELGMALVRFLSLSDDWRQAEVRFLLLNDDPSRGDALYKSAQRALADARVQSTVKLINDRVGDRSYEDWVRQESMAADLVVVGLPERLEADGLTALDQLASDIGSVIVGRSSSRFPTSLKFIRDRDRKKDDEPEAYETMIDLAPLAAPEPGVLAHAAVELSVAHDELVRGFHRDCLGPLYRHDAALIEQLRGIVDRAFVQFRRGINEPVSVRQRKLFNKAQGGFLFQARRILSEFEGDRLEAQKNSLERRIEDWVAHAEALDREAPKTLAVMREPEVLRTDEDDEPHLRRIKRRLRARRWLKQGPLSYEINSAGLYTYYLRFRSLEILNESLGEVASDTYRDALALGRTISAVRDALDELQARARTAGEEGDDPRELPERLDERRDEILAMLAGLAERNNQRSKETRDLLLRASRRMCQSFADDLDRLDHQRVIRRQRKVPRAAEELTEQLEQIPEQWYVNRKLLLSRAALELHNAGFAQRLGTIVQRTKDTVALNIQHGALSGCQTLHRSLVDYRDALEVAHAAATAAGTDTEQPRLDEAEAGDPPDPEAAESDVETEPERARFIEPPRPRLSHELRIEFDDKRMLEELSREVHTASSELPDSIEIMSDETYATLDDQPFEEPEPLTVSLRRLVDYLVEAELLGGLRDQTMRVALAEQRALGIAQDVVHLVAFNLSELDAHDDDDGEHDELRERIVPVINNGIGRLEAEIGELEALLPDLAKRMDVQLGRIIDRAEAYAVTGSEDAFKSYARSDQRHSGALAAVGNAATDAAKLSREAVVRLLYRWSAGVLLARRMQTDEQRGNVVERVLAMVSDNTPKPKVLEVLPFFYSQPFLGQARVSVDFWVGRKQELAEASRAIRNWKQGRQGVLLIVGERGSGKTSLCRLVARRNFERKPRYALLPPRGGSIDLATFRARLEKELKTSGSFDEMFAAVPEGSVIVIHDLELWWERSREGLKIVELLLELAERHSERVCFIFEISRHAQAFIDRLVPLSDRALAVVECQPLDAESLKDVVEIRHRSTGLRYELDHKDEDELPAWNKARLFTRYFDYTGGYVGVALQSWITHVDKVDGERLVMRSPKAPDLDVLDELRLPWVATILQFVLHKRLTRARLARVVGGDDHELVLLTLLRAGLLVEDKQGTIEINRYIQHMLVERLCERGYL